MELMHMLESHLKTRLVELNKAKQQGRKIVGYTPGGYLPEELVLASGAIPICLVRGGDHSVVELAGAYICRWIDTFCRAQIGYALSGDDPYYSVVDLFRWLLMLLRIIKPPDVVHQHELFGLLQDLSFDSFNCFQIAFESPDQ